MKAVPIIADLARMVVAASVILGVLAGCAGSIAPSKAPKRGMPNDIGGVVEEKQFREIEIALPSYPAESALLEFKPRRNSANSFYIDRDSVSIGADRVVRYTSVVKSPSGVRNTTYEGLRCKTAEFKVYAFGVKIGEWTMARDAQWRQIERSSANFRFALYKDYICDIESIAGHNERDLVANLRGNRLNNVTDKNR